MTQQEINDIIQWDVRSWSKALDFWDSEVDWNSVENSLELGGREGGLSLWLALKGKRVICSDLHNVKATAEPLHKKYNATSLISYQDIDATMIPYENYFDVIIFKSIIGSIGHHDNKLQQQKVFDQIYRALKPGGKLLFAENLRGGKLLQRLRKKHVEWGSNWRYVSLDELDEFLEKYSARKIFGTGTIAVLGRNEGQRRFLSYFDSILLNPLFASDNKYVAYGVAVK